MDINSTAQNKTVIQIAQDLINNRAKTIPRGWFAWVNVLFGEWIDGLVCAGALKQASP